MSDKHTIINVGREFGSGGKQVAEELGRRLGITVYDAELLSKAAQNSGLSPAVFQRRDEKRRLWRIGNMMGFDDSEAFRIQSSVIREIALNGDAIFIGRTADYILRDMNCLNVFVKAPLEYRSRIVAEREGISVEDAAELIEKRDRARAQYYNFYTFGHWGKAVTYDLCVDSSILSVGDLASIIIEYGTKSGKIL